MKFPLTILQVYAIGSAAIALFFAVGPILGEFGRIGNLLLAIFFIFWAKNLLLSDKVNYLHRELKERIDKLEGESSIKKEE